MPVPHAQRSVFEENPLNVLGYEVYKTCEAKGFHESIDHEIAEKAVRLLLIITELCEAFEVLRKGGMVEDHDEEVADVAIRLLHYASYEGIDLDAEVERKMAINEKRPYKHGKRF